MSMNCSPVAEFRNTDPKQCTDLEECYQWVADVYHCSDCWGQTMTEEDMRETLIEHQKEKFPDEYSPDPALAAECAAYWNKLCAMYPN